MEKLYLINDSYYLHIQEIDEGWDFTLYDKDSMKGLDGGQLDDDRRAYDIDQAFDEITSIFDIVVTTKEEIEDCEDLIEELQNESI